MPRRSSQSQHSAPVVVVLVLLVVVVLWSYVGVVCERVGFLWQRQAGCSVDYYGILFEFLDAYVSTFFARALERQSLQAWGG